MAKPHTTKNRRRFATFASGLLRVAVGAIFFAHGWQKLSDVTGTVAAFTRLGIPAPEAAVYLAIAAEIAGGLGLLLGAFTTAAALALSAASACAILFVQAGDGFFIQHGGWEYSLTLLLVCLHFAARGAGPHSTDARRKRRVPRFRRRHRQLLAPG